MAMRLGVRGKLIFVSVMLFLLGALASGALLEHKLRVWLEARIENDLLYHARTARTAIQTAAVLDSVERVDALAGQLAKARPSRVTIVAADGTVMGDSSLTPAQVRLIQNHGSRPEVRQALEQRVGESRRHSVTTGSDMLYVAVPFHRSVAGTDTQASSALSSGVVRVAMPLDQVDQTIARLRILLLLGGLLGLGAAVLMSVFASHLLARTLRKFVDSARALSRGEGASISVSSRDEIGRLAGSFNRLGKDLERSLSALANARDRFETVLESMTEAVVALDSRQRITMFNSAAMKLLQLDQSPVGQPLLEAVRVPALHELLAEADTSSTSAEFELHHPLACRVLAHAAPLPADGGTVLAMHDVTEMRRLEMVRQDFVANVSHELRTPVSVIQANTETLLHGALDDPKHARVFVAALHRNAERLASIVSDLLDLSRIEAGRYALSIASLSVGSAARRAADAMERPTKRRNQTLTVSAPEDLYAHADSKALDQVLLNLLENAVKYTPEGGTIEVRASADETTVRVEVCDDGPGIEPRHRTRIFERFYRVDPGRSRDMGGTGLGLAIVKHLVDAMNGQVGVQPAWPRGSIFWVHLPRASQDRQANHEPTEGSVPSPAPTPRSESTAAATG